MNRSTTLWTCLVLAGAGVCTGGCKHSSDVSQAQREGGMPDDPFDVDGGNGGHDGVDDENYRPPLVPPHKPPTKPTAGSPAPPLDAAAPDTGHVVDPEPIDAGTKPDDDDAGGTYPGVPTEIIQAELCRTICRRGVALLCEYEGSYDECVSLCGEPVPDCDEEVIEVLMCKAACPLDGYKCDEDFGAFVVLGCEDYEIDLQRCRLN